MPEYEGFVASLKEDGKAEVIIQPVSPGIPGASREVNTRVCHCATGGSTITIEALNMAGAGTGDWVSVSRKSADLMKNAALLLGIPLFGLLLGVVAGAILTHGFTLDIAGGVLAVAVCLLLGIIIGVIAFRKVSAGYQPIIDRIVRTRLETASLFDKKKPLLQNNDRFCESCFRPLK